MSRRFGAPSLTFRASQCIRTVRGEIASSPAISALVCPAATLTRTWRCRHDRATVRPTAANGVTSSMRLHSNHRRVRVRPDGRDWITHYCASDGFGAGASACPAPAPAASARVLVDARPGDDRPHPFRRAHLEVEPDAEQRVERAVANEVLYGQAARDSEAAIRSRTEH